MVIVLGLSLKYLAAATTLETCLEHPFTQPICKQTIALETAERMQQFFGHCELLRRMNYCTNYCDGKQLLQRHPLRNPPLLRLRTPKTTLSIKFAYFLEISYF